MGYLRCSYCKKPVYVKPVYDKVKKKKVCPCCRQSRFRYRCRFSKAALDRRRENFKRNNAEQAVVFRRIINEVWKIDHTNKSKRGVESRV